MSSENNLKEYCYTSIWSWGKDYKKVQEKSPIEIDELSFKLGFEWAMRKIVNKVLDNENYNKT